MSASGFTAGMRRCGGIRGAASIRSAAIFAAALTGLIAAAGSALAAPTVTNVSPNSGPAAGGTSVTITGTGFIIDSGACTPSPGFVNVTAVKFGSANATSFVVNGITQITATSPAGTGTVDVTVTTTCISVGGSHTSATSPADQFTYTSGSTTDSQNLHTLEIVGTATNATISGQVITSQVDAAIGDAFSTGTTPITPGPNGLFLNFAAEPQRDAATQDAIDALAYASKKGGTAYKVPPPAPVADPGWSAWADVRGTGFDQSSTTTHEEQINATGGIGRKLSPNLLVGLFAGYENFSFTMESIAGKLTGDGGTIGGYAAWRYAEHWRADAMFGWTDMAYNGTAGAASGQFRGSRWLGSGGLTGNYNWAGFLLEPSARLYTLWERDTAFTDTLGTAQPSRDFSSSRASAGDKISYPWQATSALTVVPYLGAYADFHFSNDTALPVGVPFAGIKDGWSGRVTSGVTLKSGRAAGPTLSLGGELGGLGAGYDIWSANARANWPF